MRVALLIVFCVALASVSFAQIDAFTLRFKYGAPLDRETFTVRPGIEMVVDYGPGKRVCKIQLPSGERFVGTVPPGTVPKEEIDAVMEELLPPPIRGKELNRMMMAFGVPMLSVTEYEHVRISELKNGRVGSGITIAFKDAACPQQKAP